MGRKLFVVNSHGNSVSVFDVDDVLARFAAGEGVADVAPVRMIASMAGIASPQGVFVDAVNDEIFVANSADSSVRVYDRTASGDAAPMRVIAGFDTELFSPQGVFVDTLNNEIFVVNLSNVITIYDRDAEGNRPPKRRIFTESFNLQLAVSVDAARNEVFVTGYDFSDETAKVLIFDRQADSGGGLPLNIPPKAVIEIPGRTSEGFPFLSVSIFYDPQRGELFVLNTAIFSQTGGVSLPVPGLEAFPVQRTPDGSIQIYTRAGDGTFALRQEIRGPETGLLIPFDISVNTETGEIFVANFFDNTVTVYAQQDGIYLNEPSRALRTGDFGNSSARRPRFNLSSLFFDTLNGELAVAAESGTVSVYRETDSGRALPQRVIGQSAGLSAPRWISLDAARGEIYVSNFASGQITVYPMAGGSRPLRVISIEPRLLSGGIAYDPDEDVLFVANQLSGNDGGFIDFISAYRTADGVPIRNLSGADTHLGDPQGISIDGDRLFAANIFADSVTVYDKSAAGNAPPIAVIREDEFSFPSAVFADSENIFITNFLGESVSVYGSADTGTRLALIREGLRSPAGIFADDENIYVANAADNSVAIYRRAAPFPLAGIIRGERAGLFFPVGIAVANTP